MTEPDEPLSDPSAPAIEDALNVEDEEVVDGLPVLAEVRELRRAPTGGFGVVHTAAAAATGFVAGAATLALARRYGARRLERMQGDLGGLAPRRPGSMLPVTGTRTYLVHVHVIRPPIE